MGRLRLVFISKDSMAKKLDKGAGITAVAAVVEHNTIKVISNRVKLKSGFG